MKYRKVIVKKRDGTTIPEDEPVFVLRAQDILAPVAVRMYAFLVQMATGNSGQAREIEEFADSMMAWPNRKLPD